MKTCLIVCDGELNTSILKKTLKSDKPRQTEIISCDGASDFLFNNKITPDYIVGDLDTIKAKTLAYYKKKKVKIVKLSSQNKNDLEKALNLALKKNFKNVSVIGLTGKRPDHSLNNFSILKRYYHKTNIRVYDKYFEIILINKSIEFKCKKGDIVSLIPLPKAHSIKTYGLKYPLKNESLEFGKREGALNEATGDYVKINVKSGELLVFKKY